MYASLRIVRYSPLLNKRTDRNKYTDMQVYSSIYFKTLDQKIEDHGFSQQFYHQFSCNPQEFTNLTPLNEKILKKFYRSLCFKNGLIWLIKKLKILDFFKGFKITLAVEEKVSQRLYLPGFGPYVFSFIGKLLSHLGFKINLPEKLGIWILSVKKARTWFSKTRFRR